jgi:sodium-dependent dicarboxylate transporter 2/3/5
VGLHKRIALKIISIFGGTANSILFGFMFSAAFLSMWISNTATAVMMLPIALAVITKIENEFGKDETKNFSKSVLLGIAYSCSIGGIATLIGTPPNLALVRIHKIAFPIAPQISFGDWMLLAFPITVILLILTAILLSKIVFKSNKSIRISKDFIADEYKSLGSFSFPEKIIMRLSSRSSMIVCRARRHILALSLAAHPSFWKINAVVYSAMRRYVPVWQATVSSGRDCRISPDRSLSYLP